MIQITAEVDTDLRACFTLKKEDIDADQVVCIMAALKKATQELLEGIPGDVIEELELRADHVTKELGHSITIRRRDTKDD